MAEQIIMPRLGDFMTEGTVAKWAKASGETVAQGEVIVEIESEKLNYELEAARSGVLHTVATEGDVVPVGIVLGFLLDEGEAPPEPVAPAQPAASAVAAPPRASASPGVTGPTTPSTPGARRLAAKLGVDIAQVSPTGPRGRVTEADVRGHEGVSAADRGERRAHSTRTRREGLHPGDGAP